MFGPSVERDAPTMASSRRLALRCAVLTFLTGAGVAFLLPGSGADSAAWALLVMRLPAPRAVATTSEPPRRPSPARRARDASQRRTERRRPRDELVASMTVSIGSCRERGRRDEELIETVSQHRMSEQLQVSPSASIARATRVNPTMFAPAR
jgi:hypothetical protein